MATGYEDIDTFGKQQEANLKAQAELQNKITDMGTQKTINELNYNKAKIDPQTNKTTSGLYTDYQKEVNQYGAQADAQARKGLANSGYAETSRVNLYNTYQKNVTETVNSANQLKADFDFQMAQARQQGDITKAQNAYNLMQQQMQLAVQQYEFRQNRQQFLYQQQRDKVSDKQWKKQFEYQKSRDKVADKQWEKQFALQKKTSASSGRSSRASGSRRRGSTRRVNNTTQTQPSVKQDVNTGKTRSLKEVLLSFLNSKGVAVVK